MRNTFFTKHLVHGEGEKDPEMDSVFNWTKNQRAWMYLTGFLFFSLIIHGAGFYLFKVVYPAPTRIEAKGESITLMDPTDPGVRALMKRIEDRTVFLFPPSKDAGIRVEIGEGDVRYSPSYRDANLELKQPSYPWSLPPAIDTVMPPAGLNAPQPRFDVAFLGAISECKVAPWSILQDYLEQLDALPSLSVKLSVLRDGTVAVAGVEGDMSESDRKKFADVVETTLRFLPVDDPVEGRIRIQKKPGRSSQMIESE